MSKWGPEGKQGAVAFSFDNMGEAALLEFGRWPKGEPIGFHQSIFETLPFLLGTLKEFGLRATFFLEAWNIEHYPDAVWAIAEAGHEIGSHGYRHETWFMLADEHQRQTLNKAHDLYTRIGLRPVGFRPPGGISMAAMEAFAKTLGYRTYRPSVAQRARATASPSFQAKCTERT